jgi:N-acyl-D-amino-acid deacylase
MLNPDGGGPVDIQSVRKAFERRGTGVNTGLFVPHGSIRQQVLGMADRAPTAPELQTMVDLVTAGMKAGGVGLSSGLYYAPGSYARTDEVVAMARAAGELGGVYSSHIRDEGDYNIGVVAAVEEVIQIAEEGRLPGIVSHMKALGAASWGLSLPSLMRIEAARSRGVEVWADQYPYEASGTSITGALVPRWAQVGGDDALRKRALGAERGRLRDEIRANIARRGGAASLQISRFAPDPKIEGKTIADLAQSTGESPEEVALDLLARGGAGLVSFNMNERDIEEIMTRPYTMTSTDGDLVPMGVGKPHPRAYGAFTRKLRLYVRERKVIDWPAAIRSMTHLPAMVFGLKDRGQLRVGAWADILLFDPEKVADKATYENPHQLSVGIDTIVVNGKLVRDEGTFTGALAGKVLAPDRR